MDYGKKTVVLCDNLEFFKTQGRINSFKNGIALDFTASAIEFCADCEGDVIMDFSLVTNPEFCIIIDGAKYVKKLVENNRLIIAENLPKGVHTFKVIKNLGTAEVTATSITLCGTLLPREKDRERTIEIIGDSITCGASNTIVVKDDDGKVLLHDVDGNITRVTVEFKNNTDGTVAEYDIGLLVHGNEDYWSVTVPNSDESDYTVLKFAKSDHTATHKFYTKNGSLFASVPYISPENNKYVTYCTNGITAYSYLLAEKLGYDYTIFCQSGQRIENLSELYYTQYGRETTDPYVPIKDPDVVFINMDTNSCCSTEEYKDAMARFVKIFKERNPKVKIIFAYGVMKKTWLYTAEHGAIRKNAEELGGKSENIYTLLLPIGRDGGGGHPSVANGRIVADVTCEFIKKIMDK